MDEIEEFIISVKTAFFSKISTVFLTGSTTEIAMLNFMNNLMDRVNNGKVLIVCFLM